MLVLIIYRRRLSKRQACVGFSSLVGFLLTSVLRFPSYRCFCICGDQVKENSLVRGGLKAYYCLPGDYGNDFVPARASSGLLCYDRLREQQRGWLLRGELEESWFC